MNDRDWWAATTLAEAKVDYLKHTHKKADEDARELTGVEMQDHQFYSDGNREDSISFAEQLEILTANKNERFPKLFASTEF